MGGYLTLAERASELFELDRLHNLGVDPAEQRRPRDPRVLAVAERDPLAWLDAERDWLVAAVEQAAAARLWELAWRLGHLPAAFFQWRVHWDDWQRTHLLAVRAAQGAGNRGGEASVLRSLGELHRDRAGWQEATRCFEQSLSIARDLRDRRCEANALRGLGRVYGDQGHLAEAAFWLEASLAACRELGDRPGEADTLRTLALLHGDTGNFDDALGCARRCLAVFRRLGDRPWEAATLHDLGIFTASGAVWTTPKLAWTSPWRCSLPSATSAGRPTSCAASPRSTADNDASTTL